MNKPKNVNDLMIDALTQVGGDKTAIQCIFGQFHLMAIAEQEIHAAKLKRQPYNILSIMRPSKFFPNPTSDDVYRHHVNELCLRIRDDQDTRNGTIAEMMFACSYASLNAPFTHHAGALYAYLFAQVFPNHAIVKENERIWSLNLRDQFEFDAHLEGLSKACRDSTRVPIWEKPEESAQRVRRVNLLAGVDV